MWRPEIDLIETLCGEDTPLHVVYKIFNNPELARRVLTIYLEGNAITFQADGEILPVWQAKKLIQSDFDHQSETEIVASITPAAAKAFSKGTWDTFFNRNSPK